MEASYLITVKLVKVVGSFQHGFKTELFPVAQLAQSSPLVNPGSCGCAHYNVVNEYYIFY